MKANSERYRWNPSKRPCASFYYDTLPFPYWKWKVNIGKTCNILYDGLVVICWFCKFTFGWEISNPGFTFLLPMKSFLFFLFLFFFFCFIPSWFSYWLPSLIEKQWIAWFWWTMFFIFIQKILIDRVSIWYTLADSGFF